MTIKKIFSLVATILFALMLISCDQLVRPKYRPQYQKPEVQVTPDYGVKEKPEEVVKQRNQRLKVGVLLPLSGKNAKIGQSMLNSINMSLFDNDKSAGIELFIFDNKSSNFTSKKLMQQIADQNIKIVIGPIFTGAVESVIEIAKANDIAVISLSNNSDLINYDGIFLAGFSLEQEIDRITSYLINNGKINFSVIAPNNQYGARITKTLRKMTQMKDGNFISSQFYIKKQQNFNKIARKIYNSYIVSKEIDDYKEELEAIEDIEERKIRELEIVNDHKIYTDTVLIAESGSKVFKILNAIKDNDKDGRNLQIIGISHWDKDVIIENEDMNGALFAGPSNRYFDRFEEKYVNLYKSYPSKIDSIGYDVTAFVIGLVDEIEDEKSADYYIVNYNNKKGYKGINGLFRFLPNGLIERNLSVMEINSQYLDVVGSAPSRFLRY